MHMTLSVASIAAIVGALALAPATVQANPAHHGDSAETPGQTAETSTAQSSPRSQSSPPGGGMMSGGMMGGGAATGPGMGSGMMGPDMMMRMMQMHGMGGGMMGGGMMGGDIMGGDPGPCGMMGDDRDLSSDRVRDILEGRLAWIGNNRLKVGKVETKDNNSYLVEIVTVDDSLVQKLEIDRKTGVMRPVD